MAKANAEILQAALIGYAEQRRMIEAKIANLKEQLASSTPTVVASEDGAKPKRKLSAAGRREIREAVKKRWAAFRSAKAEKPALAKRLPDVRLGSVQVHL